MKTDDRDELLAALEHELGRPLEEPTPPHGRKLRDRLIRLCPHPLGHVHRPPGRWEFCRLCGRGRRRPDPTVPLGVELWRWWRYETLLVEARVAIGDSYVPPSIAGQATHVTVEGHDGITRRHDLRSRLLS